MPAAQRDGDANSAGGVVSSSSSVKVNGKDITTNGDSVSSHAPFISPHVAATTANGSSTVKAEGIAVNRTTDSDTCGHARVGGSDDVNVGG